MASLAELVATATELAAQRRVILGIVGPPGAGKSTVTRALHGALSTWDLVEMDGYHLANDVLLGLGRRHRKGAPDTFDVDGFVALLGRVRDAHDPVVYAPRFRREIEEPVANALPVRAGSPGVIVEGNYLLHDALGWNRVRPLLDAVWYIDTPPDVCRHRLLERAQVTYSTAEAAAKWVDTVDEPNAALVRASRDRADLLVTLDV